MNTQKGFAPVLIVLILAAALVGGYFIYQKQSKPAPQPQIISQPSPNPADETANWKTYANSAYRFSFKYPREWNTSNKNNAVDISNENSGLRFQISPYPSVDFDKLYEKPNGTVNQNPVFVRTKIKNLEIDGYKATMYINESTATNQYKGFDISVYIVKGAPITMISGQTDSSSKEKFLSIFNQVLSTFKFIQ